MVVTHLSADARYPQKAASLVAIGDSSRPGLKHAESVHSYAYLVPTPVNSDSRKVALYFRCHS